MRRFLALTAFLIALPAFAAWFPDTAGHPHEEEIDFLAQHGVVEGYPSGLFGPDFAINRAEFLKILLLSAYGATNLQQTNLDCFSDFRGNPQWFWTYACTAKTLGLVEGHPDGTFRGETQINLAEALKMIMAAWPTDLPALRPSDPWYMPYMRAAEERGLFDNFLQDPAYQLTRSDMVYLIVHVGGPIVGVVEPGLPTCGNGIIEATESCDDGNRRSGDGCSSQCREEIPGPTPGGPVCGNGILEPREECDDGNLKNGDGCSQICVIVPEPIRHGALQIEQRAASAGTIAAGAQNALLYAFDGVAGRQDVQLTGVDFEFSQGDAEDFIRYTLLGGPSGGQLRQLKTGIARGDKVDFSNIDFFMEEGVRYRFEVRGDLRTNAGAGTYRLDFATSDPAFITAVGVRDARDLSGITVDGGNCFVSVCWIAVTTMDVPPVTSEARGNLFVEEALPALDRQVLAGSETPDLLRISFEAEAERLEVTDLRIAGYPPSAHELRIYVDGQPTQLASATPARCATAVAGVACANLSLELSAGQTRTISVRAVLKSDAEGADSGEAITLSLPVGGNVVAVEALGVDSQADLVLSDADAVAEGEIFIGRGSPGINVVITGPTHDVVFSRILTIENSNPDANGSPILLGVQRLARFRFTAATNENTSGGRNDVILERLRFTVSASNITLDQTSFALVDPSSALLSAPCTASSTTGVITVTCDNLQSSSLDATINSSAARDVELRANVTAVQSSPGSAHLTVSLNQLANRNIPGAIRWNDEVTSFEWVDLTVTEVRSTEYDR